MRKAVYLFLLFCFSIQLLAQQDPHLVGQKRWIRIVPLLQHFSIDQQSVSEYSVPIRGYYPVNRELGISFHTGRAMVTAKNNKNYSGFSDLQLCANYYLEAQNLVFHMGMNLPVGKEQLSVEEFQTSTLLSLNQLNFRMPVLGQGFNLAPGLTWARPLNDRWVIGLGASYQYKGTFKPIKGMDNKYNPGNELVLTGGIDVKLNETSVITADMIFTSYGKDKIGREKVFAPGKKVVFYVSYKKYFGYHQLLIFTRYRSKSKNRLVEAGQLVDEGKKTFPDQFQLAGNFYQVFTKNWHMGYSLEWRSYENTASWKGLWVISPGVSPEYSISNQYSVPARFRFQYGKLSNGDSMTGLEFTIGMTYHF